MTRRLLLALFLGIAALAASPAIAEVPCGEVTGLALPNNTNSPRATATRRANARREGVEKERVEAMCKHRFPQNQACGSTT